MIEDEEIDQIYEKIDSLMKEGRFDIIEEMIQTAIDNHQTFDRGVLMTLLCITVPAKSKLDNRSKLYEVSTKYYTDTELRGLD